MLYDELGYYSQPTYIIKWSGFFHVEVTVQDKDQDY